MNRRSILWAILLCGAALMFSACSGDGEGDAVASCVPGEERLCPCIDGSEAIQVCASDGTYEPCQCPSSGEPEDASNDSCAPDTVGSCITTCGSQGSQVCGANGEPGDEGLECESCYEGSTEPCETSCGTEGRRSCGPSGYWETCAPPSETCNNVDDDCDGFTDEALSQACVNACGEGIEACIDGKWTGCTAPQPALEICDDLDISFL